MKNDRHLYKELKFYVNNKAVRTSKCLNDRICNYNIPKSKACTRIYKTAIGPNITFKTELVRLKQCISSTTV